MEGGGEGGEGDCVIPTEASGVWVAEGCSGTRPSVGWERREGVLW